MSQESNSTTSGTIEETLRVAVPASGARAVVAAQSAGQLALEFDPSQLADVTQSGDDLVFHFENGSTATISDFFSIATEGDMSFSLPDGASVGAGDFLAAYNIEMPETAAGPSAGGAAGGGAGDYRGDPGAFTDGIDRLGDQGTFYWGRTYEVDREDQGIYSSLSFGSGDQGLFLSTNSVNESEQGLFLNFGLSTPATAQITLTIQVGGSASSLESLNYGSAGDQSYRADYSITSGVFGNGGSYSYDPATGLLTVILGPGFTDGSIPVELIDDHISESDVETITFDIIGSSGPVVNATGSAIVNLNEDTDRANDDGLSGAYELDGPIVGVYSEVSGGLYEGGGNNNFYFGLTLTDPHSGDPYAGYNNNGLMSQDMTVVLNVGGSAQPGGSGNEAATDYHLEISPELWALVQSGQVRFDPPVQEVNGKYVVSVSDGDQISVTLTGQVDANGNLNSLPAFDLGNAGLLGFTGVLHINGGGVEGSENITISVDSVSGNEGLPGLGADAEVNLEPDPVLSLSIAAESVQESQPGFDVTLHFDKNIAAGNTFTVVLELGGSADIFDGVKGNEYLADFFLPGYKDPGAWDAAGNSTTVNINGVDVTFTLNADGTVTVSGDAAAFDDNGNLNITFPLNDDHRSEPDEQIELNIREVTLSDGTYTGTVSAGQGDSVRVVEDTVRADGDDATYLNELDGPVVGITVSPSSLYEGQYDPSQGNNLADTFVFDLSLTDPHAGGSYQGYQAPHNAAPDGVLSEALTITIVIPQGGDNATFGQDYTLTFPDIPGASMSWETGANGDIVVKVELEAGFDLGKVDDLRLEARVNPDSEKEIKAEDITLAITAVEGNEALISQEIPSAGAAIDPDPVLSISVVPREVESGSQPGDEYKYNESEQQTVEVNVALDKPVAFDTVAVVTMNVGENLNVDMDADTANDYLADLFGPAGYKPFADGGPEFQPNTFQVDDNGNIIFHVEFKAGSTSPTVELNFVINDDHSSEEGDESFSFKVDQVVSYRDGDGDGSSEWVAGPVVGTEAGGQGLGQVTETVTITEDDIPADGEDATYLHELDGPMFGVTVNGGANATVKENEGTTEEPVAGSVTVAFTAMDPHHPNSPYAGYTNTDPARGDHNALSQETTVELTMTVTDMTFGNYATAGAAREGGADFWLNFGNSTTAGTLEYYKAEYPGFDYAVEYNGADGTITVTLTLPKDFPANELNNINFKVEMVDDADTEVNLEQGISLEITAVQGNESSIGEGAEITVSDDTWPSLSGPFAHIEVSSEQGVNKIAESGANDTPGAVQDNTSGKINISLRAGAATDSELTSADEGVKMLITIGNTADGKGKATFGIGNPAEGDLASPVDYYLTDEWTFVQGEDGAPDYWKSTVDATGGPAGNPTLEVELKMYDNGDGTYRIEFEMPKGYTGIELGFAANDDLREYEGNETFDVTLSLVEKGSGLAYGETQLADPKDGDKESLTGNTATVTIEQDERTDVENATDTPNPLNPYTFDGPYVNLAVGDNSPGLTGNNTDGWSVNESGGNSVALNLYLTNPDGSATRFGNTEETVTVTLKIAPVEGTTTLNIHDFYKPEVDNKYDLTFSVAKEDGTLWTKEELDGNADLVKSFTDLGYTYNANGTFTAPDAVDGSNMQITVELPAGVSGIQAQLPINDDPLGADGNSRHDQPLESFTVEVVGVEGNEARLDETMGGQSTGTGEVTIVDDVVDNPAITTDDANLEGVGIGLTWATKGDYKSENDLAEGNTAKLHVKVTLPGGENPYEGYTAGGGLPDKLTLTFNFTDTKGGDDVKLSIDGDMYTNLIKTGKVTVTCWVDGKQVTIDGTNYKSAIDSNTEIIIEVAAGTSLDALADIAFIATGMGDNINEWDKSTNYKDYTGQYEDYNGDGLINKDDAKIGESFNVTLTSVVGNETYIDTVDGKQANSVTGYVHDMANGTAYFMEGSGAQNDANDAWEFKVNVKYGDDEGNWGTNDKNDPGEAVHLKIKFTDSGTMQHGANEEYDVSAYSLFLSMNKGKVTDGAEAKALFDLYNTLDDSVLLEIANGTSTNSAYEDLAGLVLVRDADGNGSESWTSGPNSSNTYDVYAPKEVFGGSGTLDFSVDMGANQASKDPFSVEIVKPYEGDSANHYDAKGEIIDADNSNSLVLVGTTYVVGLKGGTTIVEDPDMNNAGLAGTHDTYTVYFDRLDVNGNSWDNANPLQASANIKFDLTIRNITAGFDFNTTDNHLPNQIGDYAFGDGQGGYLEYASAADLKTELQKYFDDLYGEGMVKVDGVTFNNDGVTLQLDVAEGFDLRGGIEIDFKALDDNRSDSGEKFSMQVSNVSSYQANDSGVEDPLNIVIKEGANSGTTTILDEGTDDTTKSDDLDVNGFALALGEGTGYELAANDGGVLMTVRAFGLTDKASGTGGRVDDTDVIKLDTVLAAYGKKVDFNDADEFKAFAEFVLLNYGPTQDITFNLKFTDAEGKPIAVYGEDFKDLTQATITPDQWTVVVGDDGNIHFEAQFPVQTINDYLSEGDEYFQVSIDSVVNQPGTGNESRPIKEGEVTGESATSVGKIIDVHDGPSLVSFGPDGGVIYEPIDTEHGPSKTTELVFDYQKGDLTLKFTNNMAGKSDVAVRLSEAISGVGEYGTDWVFDCSSGEKYVYFDGTTLYALDPATGLQTGSPLDQSAQNLTGQFQTEGYYLIVAQTEPGNGGNDLKVTVTIKVFDENFDQSDLSFTGLTDEDFMTSHPSNAYEGVEIGAFTPVKTPQEVIGTEPHLAEPKSVLYSVVLDAATEEDVVVWMRPDMSVNNDDKAEYGVDYVFGEKVYWYEGGKVYKLGEDGLKGDEVTDLSTIFKGGGKLPAYFEAPGGSGYFTVIPEGSTSARFEVKVMDDNDTRNNDRGVDAGKEEISITIVDMQGSEVTVSDSAGNNIPWDGEACFQYTYEFNDGSGNVKITGVVDPLADTFTHRVWNEATKSYEDVTLSYDHSKNGNEPDWFNNANRPTFADAGQETTFTDEIKDDMRGPGVGFTESERLSWSDKSDPTVHVKIADYASEDVNVFLQFYDSKGAPAGDPVAVTVSDMAAFVAGTLSINLNDYKPGSLGGNDFYVRISSTEGGETRWSSKPLFCDHGGDGAGGKDSSLHINGFESNVITEGGRPGEAGTSVEYTLKVEMGGETPTAPAEFTLNFLNGSADTGEDLVPGTGQSVKITIGVDDQKLIQAAGPGQLVITKDGLTFIPDDSSKPQFSLEGTGTKVEGDLPTAIGDDKVEGTEEFYTIIGGGQGVDVSDGVAVTEILDQTNYTLVFVDKDGNLLKGASFDEGSGSKDLTAMLALCDDKGELILDGDKPIPVQANERMEFDLTYGSNDGAKENSDYTGSSKVVIEAGSSSGQFEMIFHEDYITEGPEHVTINAKLSAETNEANGKGAAGSLTEHYKDSGATTTVTINDVINGPEIRWNTSATEVREDGSMTVYIESYKDNTRTVVSDKVISVFELKAVDGSGFDVYDIASIEVDGKVYTHNPSGDELDIMTLVDSVSGVITVTSTMSTGTALDQFTINFNNDVKSEGNELFTIALKETHGSETERDNYDYANTGKSPITVTDVLNGPTVDIAAGSGSEEDLVASVVVSFSGGKVTGEDASVTLTLAEDAAGRLDLTAFPDGFGAYIYDAGDPASKALFESLFDGDVRPKSFELIDHGDGTYSLKVTMAEGSVGGADTNVKVTVNFPILDNSLAGRDDFHVSLTGRQGGELQGAAVPSYEAQWWGESGASSGNASPANDHGGSNTFKITTDENGLGNVSGDMKIVIGGVADADVIKSIEINGKPLQAGDWTYDPNTDTITIVREGLGNEYLVKVTYAAQTEANQDDISKTKTDIGIKSAGVDSSSYSREVNVPIADESTAGKLDALTLSVNITEDSIGEGGTLNGSFTIAGGDLPGDSGTVEGSISFQFTATPNPDGSYNTITLANGLTGVTLSGPVNGIYTVTLDSTARLPADIGFTVETRDNSLVDNQNYGLSVVDGSFKAEAYEGVDYGAKSDSAVVTDDPLNGSRTGPTINVGSSVDNVTEGGEVPFTLTSDSAAWGELPLNTQCQVEFTISNLQPGDVVKVGGVEVYTEPASGGNGSYNGAANATSAADGAAIQGVTVSTSEQSGLNDGRNLTLTVTGITKDGNPVFESVASDPKTVPVIELGADLGFSAGETTLMEGQDLAFSLALSGTATGDAPITCKFQVTAPAGLLADTSGPEWSNGQNSELYYTATLADGQSALDVTIPLAGAADGVIDGSENVAIVLVAFNPGEAQVELDGINVGDIVNYTVKDADYSAVEDILGELGLVMTDVQGMELRYADDTSGEYDGSTLGSSQFIVGNDTPDSVLTGGQGDDILVGGAGGGSIYGGEGSDILFSGGGSDILYGGGEGGLSDGAEDLFVWTRDNMSDAPDQVMDFELNFDKIALEGLDLSSLNNADDKAFDNGTFSVDNFKAMFESDKVTLEVTEGNVTQTIEVNFSGAAYYEPENSDDAKAMLISILTNSL